MNISAYRLLGLMLLVVPSYLEAVPTSFISELPFTIGVPGLYVLSDNVSFATSATAITINSDNVTLNLNGKTISSTVASTNGIAILSGSTTSTRVNVAIKNGTLQGFDGFGITGSGTLYRDIVLQDVTVIGVQSTSTGIAFSNTVDSLLERCNSFNNTLGVSFNTCRNIRLNLSRFNNNIGVSNVNGMKAVACDTFVLTDCEFSFNIGMSGDGLGAFLTSGGSSWVIRNCAFSNNRSDSTSTATGQGLQAQTYNSFKVVNCAFNDNRTTSASTSNGAQGMLLLSCTAWHIQDCEFLRNRISGGTGAVDGFFVNNGGAHLIERCNFSANRTDDAVNTGTVNGFRFLNVTDCAIRNCFAVGNKAVASGTTANGFNLSSGNSSNSFERCEGSGNEATLTSQGFQDVSGGKNSFVSCRAVGQKATTARGFLLQSTFSNLIHDCQVFSQVEGIRDLGVFGNNLYTANLAAANSVVNLSDNIRTSTIPQTAGTAMVFNLVFFDNQPTGSTAFTDRLSNYSIS